MFDSAQEDVGIPKQPHLVRWKNVQLFERDQSFETVSFLEESISGPVQELQGLQDEFDFPDATVPQLHIEMEIRQPDDLSFNPRFERCDFVQQIGGNDPWKNKRL